MPTARTAPSLALLLGLLALTGCGAVKALEGPPQDLRTLYHTALGAPLTLRPTTAPTGDVGDDPVATLRQPPRIQKVWVPPQRAAEGDLVTGHWTYLLLDAPQWRLEPASSTSLPLAPLPLPPSPAVPPPPQASPLPAPARSGPRPGGLSPEEGATPLLPPRFLAPPTLEGS